MSGLGDGGFGAVVMAVGDGIEHREMGHGVDARFNVRRDARRRLRFGVICHRAVPLDHDIGEGRGREKQSRRGA